MIETLTRARMTKRDWRRHVLALVLFAVLVWYTLVSPSYTAAPPSAPGSEPKDAEEREAETQAARRFAGPLVAPTAGTRSEESEIGVRDDDQLDWPEIIGDD